MRWRTRPNGDLFAPKKGAPPEIPEGYCRDDHDPFLAHPKLDECLYRFQSTEQLSCGKIQQIIECDFHKRFVTQLECFKCTVPEREIILLETISNK